MPDDKPLNHSLLRPIPDGLEIIIKELGRPSFIIRNGTFQIDPVDDSWAMVLKQKREVINQAIRAVGQINSVPSRSDIIPGTGWLVAPNVIVTNAHVVRVLGENLTIDFRQEDGISFKEEYPLKLLHEKKNDDIDIAFLELVGRSVDATIQPIALFDGVIVENEQVITIGYPFGAGDAGAGDNFSARTLKRIFGNFVSKKSLQPGQINRNEANFMGHDCSTTKGNSGSPVLSLSSGKALGLHGMGDIKTANQIIPASMILRELSIALTKIREVM